jgi:hypothetical protein
MQHHALTFKAPIVELLYNAGVLNERTSWLLGKVHEHGGFIAGGFATKIASMQLVHGGPEHWLKTNKELIAAGIKRAAVHLGTDDPFSYLKVAASEKSLVSSCQWYDRPIETYEMSERPVINELKRYMGIGMGSAGLDFNNIHQTRHFWKKNMGDIDVWFRNRYCLETFLFEVKQSPQYLEPARIVNNITPAGFGEEFICFAQGGLDGQLVQTITKFLGSPEEIVDGFDIYNAACYIVNDQLFIPEGWEWLFQNKMIHIHTWKQNYMMSRLAKWVKKHGYDNGLTPASLQMLNDNIDQVIQDIEAGGYAPVYRENAPPRKPYDFIFNYLHPIMRCFSSENLMKLSMYYPPEAYNYPMKELYRRTSASLQPTIEKLTNPKSQVETDLN